MQPSTEVLERLVGQVLRAITQPRSEHGQVAIEQARAAAQEASTAIHSHGLGLHQPSFDLWVATTIVQVLNGTTQNLWLSDLRVVARAIPHGLETLQEIARLNALGDQPTQQELANWLGVDRGNFNRRIRKLANLGLIESNRRRQALVYALTALGEEVAQVRPVQRATLSDALRASASTFSEIIQRQRKPIAAHTWMSTADVDIAVTGRAFEFPVSQVKPSVCFEGCLVKFETELQGTPA
ncbi:helix-turn-helix domain-containing protein [Thermomonas fusca]|uniref:HTH crp-type domain-containing protein n=1 Tax=Thermomonas fusca TaxID=215690 RepID=A0A5R9PBP4_9GAMM|nr:helix-turn-helix domain-containing protein [Thermomonas fusca]TLX20772.1 hypothetical protein E5S66_13300 [Thermomonas fusca]